ncbi:MAG: hypothetical protein KDE62_13115 [Calditrichaeota bacterium]|nr:hypothetical protein [Calditrichota bacterium]
MEEYGIEELWDVVDTGLSFGLAVNESMEDGWQWSDISNFVGPLTTLPAAINGIEQVDDEGMNLQESEIEELSARVQAKIAGISSDHARKLVYAGAKTGLWLVRLGALIKNPDLQIVGE